MKTYTSEAVFLLTTLVNMARARPADSQDERYFINTIVLEIFEVCEIHVEGYFYLEGYLKHDDFC